MEKFMSNKMEVMIGSNICTADDYYQEAVDACLRLEMFPLIIDKSKAGSSNMLQQSMTCINKAELYIGVFSESYDWGMDDFGKSVAEFEYEKISERGVEKFIFIVTQTVFTNGQSNIELEKQKKFLERVKNENYVLFVQSPSDLRSQIIKSLSNSKYRKPLSKLLHKVVEIPTPPTPYIAHPYTLLQTRDLVGRRKEIDILSDWFLGRKLELSLSSIKIFNLVALGGMGKSALAWKWFKEVVPVLNPNLQGSVWWSFYESDAHFENFILRTLSYVSGKPVDAIRLLPSYVREKQLLTYLDQSPYLVVLDGLERILIAYKRKEANTVNDEDLDDLTSNFVGELASRLHLEKIPVSQRKLRKTIDPQAGNFLRELSQINSSRILISTRLYPSALQSSLGHEIRGAKAYYLGGLSDDDALELWKEFKVSGSRISLLNLFKTFDKHPLIIHILAGLIANYRPHPGDFDKWRLAHPNFDPFELPLILVNSHILEFALSGLSQDERLILDIIVSFHIPVTYDALVKLAVNKEGAIATETYLDSILASLEDRGLIGWDRHSNRYDLHPVVRGVTRNLGNSQQLIEIAEKKRFYFEGLPKVNQMEVKSLDEVTSVMELYYTYVELGNYGGAWDTFTKSLQTAIWHKLGASQRQAELLEMLIVEEKESAPVLNETSAQISVLDNLGVAYLVSGEPGKSIPLFRLAIKLSEQGYEVPLETLSSIFCRFSGALRVSGQLLESEIMSKEAITIDHQLSKKDNGFSKAKSLRFLSMAISPMGTWATSDSLRPLNISLKIYQNSEHKEARRQLGLTFSYISQRALWLKDYTAANEAANKAWDLAQVNKYERDSIRARHLQGAALIGLHKWDIAEEYLIEAISRAREVQFAEEEVPSVIQLAHLNVLKGKAEEAIEMLEDVLDICEEGPYRLDQVDALNVLGEAYYITNQRDLALDYANQSYQLSLCDGYPYLYQVGYHDAVSLLKKLNGTVPEVPKVDNSKLRLLKDIAYVLEDNFL
jgi:tetratricopeptide (TPR) repeat protein